MYPAETERIHIDITPDVAFDLETCVIILNAYATFDTNSHKSFSSHQTLHQNLGTCEVGAPSAPTPHSITPTTRKKSKSRSNLPCYQKGGIFPSEGATILPHRPPRYQKSGVPRSFQAAGGPSFAIKRRGDCIGTQVEKQLALTKVLCRNMVF